MHTTENTAPASAEKLAYNRRELAKALGVSVVTIWRQEKNGRLKRVPGLGTPLYSREAVAAFLAGKHAKAA